jgi:2-dehydro-3-deoxyphosphogluconate aldolase/(4S)-4-hydroxy-2-oxoglutarate aldolase
MLIDLLRRSRVLPVLVIDDPADAVPLAVALRDAGIHSLEVTLRRPAALDVIRHILAEVEGVSVGAGTVTTVAQLEQLKALGAAFAVSPGTSPALVRAARELQLPYLPGVVTPSEVMSGLDLGLTAFKFFPAAVFGGVSALRAYADVFAQASFCPTGGVGLDNAADYLSLANVVAVGSSWLAPANLLQARDWRAIGQRAATLLGKLNAPAVTKTGD